MKRDPSIGLLLGLQFLLAFQFVQLDRSAASKPNLRPIYWDVISYYAYLPALFIEHDLTLSFVGDAHRTDVDRHRYWPETTPDGHRVIKTTMGVALMMSPFFGLAHVLAPYLEYQDDGFSRPYQFAIALAGFFWGLWVFGCSVCGYELCGVHGRWALLCGSWWEPPTYGIIWFMSQPCRIVFRFFGCQLCCGVPNAPFTKQG